MSLTDDEPMFDNKIHEAIARSLRDFGYPDASAEMVRDTDVALMRGDSEMPHGIVGMFAQRQLEELEEAQFGDPS